MFMDAIPASTPEYDPFSPAVMNNPLPFYKELRRDHPVLYLPKYDAFFFSRFDDIMEMLSLVDNSLLQSEGPLPKPAALLVHNTEAPPIPATDPFPMAQRLGLPVYGEVRRAHVRPMMPRGVTGLTEFVRDTANAQLDLLLPRKRFNLIKDFAGIVSASVITRLMGMPIELAGKVLEIVNSGTRTDPELGGFDSGAVARQAIEFYLPFIEARFSAGADGSVPMVDGMIQYRFEGRALTPTQVAQQLVCAFIGGTETVPKITGHGLMELAARPDQLAAVRADLTANGPKAVEEMIRFCAPAQWFMRTAQLPVTIAGQAIRPGQRLFMLLGSALRDEREFDAPDEFRWDRAIPRVLSFGHGMHFCIGVHLARMEIQVMLDTVLRRIPDFNIAMFDMGAAVRHPSSFQWGWNDLVVELR
jgi:cytochrome P450